MDIQQHSTVHYTKARRKLPPLGLVLHNTVSWGLATPRLGASWHYQIDRDGACHQYVNDRDYAHHVRACDRWRPPWVVHRDTRVSEMNSCAVGIELVSLAGHPDCPEGYVAYTDAQYATLAELLALLHGRYGPLPLVGHGMVQRDRSDPVGLDWSRLPLEWRGDGYYHDPEEGLAMETTPEEREAMRPYFELYGVPVNTETALMKRACLAHKRDETPGPALSGEYGHTLPDGRGVIRQDFTGRVGEYDPATGGTAWVEVVKERAAA